MTIRGVYADTNCTGHLTKPMVTLGRGGGVRVTYIKKEKKAMGFLTTEPLLNTGRVIQAESFQESLIQTFELTSDLVVALECGPTIARRQSLA